MEHLFKYKSFVVKIVKAFFYFLLICFLFSCASNKITQKISGPKLSGIVVADEPYAVLSAVNVLKSGGTAADAVVSAFFVMSVTYPVAAGIGAGGSCIVYDANTNTSESINFEKIHLDPESFVGVPTAIRGLGALQARYGKLRWSQIVLHSEKLARFGFNMSRASSKVAQGYARLPGNQNFPPFIIDDLAAKEGQKIIQSDLADTLSRIRLRGGDEFYFGHTGKQFVEYSKTIGLEASFETLKNFQPKWKISKVYRTKNYNIFFPKDGLTGSNITMNLISQLFQQKEFFNSNYETKMHFLAEISSRVSVYEYFNGSYGKNIFDEIDLKKHSKFYISPNYPYLSPWKRAGHDGTTTIVALDANGQAVSCSFGMGAPFGLAKIIPGIGFSSGLVNTIEKKGWLESGSDFSSSVIVTNKKNQILFVGSGSGSPASPTALGYVLLDSVVIKSNLFDAIKQTRFFSPGKPDELWHELPINKKLHKKLKLNGHNLTKSSNLGRINAIYCDASLAINSALKECQFESDLRGFGFGYSGARN